MVSSCANCSSERLGAGGRLPQLYPALRHEKTDEVSYTPTSAIFTERRRMPSDSLKPPPEVGLTAQVAHTILGHHERVMGSDVDHVVGPFG